MDLPDCLEEFDEVLVTGTSSSPVHDFVDFRCVVATLSRTDAEGVWQKGGPVTAVKVWPCDGQPDPDGSGKIWFPVSQIRSLVVIQESRSS